MTFGLFQARLAAKSRRENTTVRTAAGHVNLLRWPNAKVAAAPAAAVPARPSGARCVSSATTALATPKMSTLFASARAPRSATDYLAPPTLQV